MEAFDLGLRLKEAREAKNLSQAQVAERIGISKTIISGYETNTKLPGSDNLKKLALQYGVSTDYLLGLNYSLVFDLDGLTERQRKYIEASVQALKNEFIIANRDVNQK